MLSMTMLETRNPVDASQRAPDAGGFSSETISSQNLASFIQSAAAKPSASAPTPSTPALMLQNPSDPSSMPPAHEHMAVPPPPDTGVKERMKPAVFVSDDTALRACPFQSGAGGRGSASNAEDLSDDYIRRILKVEVSHESCNMIRTINKQLRELVATGTVRYILGEDNCVWGFRVLEVDNPLEFNKAFRAIVTPGRDNQPLKRPTEVFMKTLRFCGVTARRGARGPRETDPDPRDFMYSYYYDFVSSKEEYNRRKLCTNGYSKEAREIAGKHKGEFLESDLMPRRTKRATELRAATAAAAAASQANSSGLDVLFEVAANELKAAEAREGGKMKKEESKNKEEKAQAPKNQEPKNQAPPPPAQEDA